MSECVVDRCGRPADGQLCPGCTAEVVTALRELAYAVNQRGQRVPGLMQDLADVVTRQTALGQQPGGKSSEIALPFHIAAAELAWDTENTVGTWARDFAEVNSHLTPVWTDHPSAAAWLSTFPALIAMHPAADEMHDEITDLVRRVRRMVDRAPDKIYLGKCGEVFEGVECTDDLYGVADRDTARCRTCGSEHDAHARWTQVQDKVRASLATAAEIAGGIGAFAGRKVNVKTVRTWAGRGIIATRGHNAVGEALHLVGEVLDTAARRLKGTAA